MTVTPAPRLAILGAGPIGLEAALQAAEAGLPFTVYERAPAVAGHVREWGHVRLFTPWETSVSPAMRARLAAGGRELPREGCPTGRELVEEVLAPLAALPEIAPHLRLGTTVRAVAREGLLKHEEIATAARGARPFRLLVEAEGEERTETAGVVLDCTGTWGTPSPAGDGGIPAPGEAAAGDAVVRTIPDLAREGDAWRGRRVLLLGAGHSAQTAARDLAELAATAPDTRVVWAVRSAAPTWGRVAGDVLPARAALADRADELLAGASPAVRVVRGVVVDRFAATGDGVRVTLRQRDGEGREEVEVDRVLALCGAVGDAGLYRQLQVHECYATSGPMKLAAALLGAAGGDCMAQTSHGVDALRSPEPGFFLLGAKSYGRNNTFLLRTGWQQVAEVMASLAAPAQSL